MTVRAQWGVVLAIVALLGVGLWAATRTLGDEIFPVGIGTAAPAFTATAVTGADSGEVRTLDDYDGQVVLLNIWATWCAPCRAEMPALDALQQKQGGGDFEVVAINVDTGSDDKPKDFLAEIGVKDLAFYREDTLKLFTDVKKRGLALGLPVTFLVDEEGCLLTHMNGPAEWAGSDAAGWIAEARGAAD